MLDTQSRLRSRLASAGSLERTGRQQPQGIEGNLELARIAFLQEVAHRISSVSMRSQVHTLTKTNTACRARHLSMVGDFKAWRTPDINFDLGSIITFSGDAGRGVSAGSKSG